MKLYFFDEKEKNATRVFPAHLHSRQNKDTTRAQETQITFSQQRKLNNDEILESDFIFFDFWPSTADIPEGISLFVCSFSRSYAISQSWFNAKKCNKKFPFSIENKCFSCFVLVCFMPVLCRREGKIYFYGYCYIEKRTNDLEWERDARKGCQK